MKRNFCDILQVPCVGVVTKVEMSILLVSTSILFLLPIAEPAMELKIWIFLRLQLDFIRLLCIIRKLYSCHRPVLASIPRHGENNCRVDWLDMSSAGH